MAAADLEARAERGEARAQIELAGRLEGEGRHEDALNWLARAAQSGDADALTRLGIKLVSGRNAPFLPADGARLLGDAAQAGGAEACERLAVLLGGGFYVRQSWDTALDLLQRGAELGSESAQAQLRILSGGEGQTDWPGLRRRVDLRPWLSPAATRTLSESPRLLAADAVASPAACAWIIAQSRQRLVRAELYDPTTGLPARSAETRLNRIANFGLTDTTLLNVLVQARIAATLGVPQAHLEAFAVLHYAVGEEYGEHVDFLDPAIPAYAAEIARMGQRVATCLIYLNDDFDGGATDFPGLGISHRGRAGDALIFHSADALGRPDRRTVHAGRPPSSGQKWLLSQFVRNRPVIGAAPSRAS